jgi:hypothetical protein
MTVTTDVGVDVAGAVVEALGVDETVATGEVV